jgi:hypothetical protein
MSSVCTTRGSFIVDRTLVLLGLRGECASDLLTATIPAYGSARSVLSRDSARDAGLACLHDHEKEGCTPTRSSSKKSNGLQPTSFFAGPVFSISVCANQEKSPPRRHGSAPSNLLETGAFPSRSDAERVPRQNGDPLYHDGRHRSSSGYGFEIIVWQSLSQSIGSDLDTRRGIWLPVNSSPRENGLRIGGQQHLATTYKLRGLY